MKQFAVIGLGRFGTSVAKTLAEEGQEVLAIDKDEELVHDIMDSVSKAVCLDSTDDRAVRSVGLQDVEVAVCAIGTDLESSILVTLLLKELGIPTIICRAVTLAHKKVLERIGATKVVLPEMDTGEELARSLVSTSDRILGRIGLSKESSIIEIVAPEEFTGLSLRDLDMRAKYGVNIIAIKKKTKVEKGREEHEEEKINVAPQADDIVSAGDILVIFGENEKIEALKVHERKE